MAVVSWQRQAAILFTSSTEAERKIQVTLMQSALFERVTNGTYTGWQLVPSFFTGPFIEPCTLRMVKTTVASTTSAQPLVLF